MEHPLKRPDPGDNTSWPWDQTYMNKCACGAVFHGPKRAPACWSCASDETKGSWLAKFQPVGAGEDPDRYGKAKIVTLRRDLNRLRAAIAKGDPIETQEAWDQCERWVDRVFVPDPTPPERR